MKILLVEPDKILADSYASYLKSVGYEVETATTAQNALNKINSAKPEIIIVELELANHSGIELLYEIRSYADLADVRIIILSMIRPSDISDHDNFMKQLKIYKYLYKPDIKINNLAELIK